MTSQTAELDGSIEFRRCQKHVGGMVYNFQLRILTALTEYLFNRSGVSEVWDHAPLNKRC